MDEESIKRVSHGKRPVVTMQPWLRGEPGELVGIVIAEVVCAENEENDLFAGLAAFVRADVSEPRAATDIALKRLLDELGGKGRKLGADAILSARIQLRRGVSKTGQTVLRLTATGTAVVLPLRHDQ